MNNDLFRLSRYDYFIIWGNGLHHADAILEIIRKEEHLQILKIVSQKIKDMKRFVFNMYACDTVPLWHLRAKINYLFKAKPEAIFIFARNLAPEERYVDDGPFRHLQCQYIARIKEKIRNLYNPRKEGKRTEEHVIHASDQEMQVDYFLKMLGYPDGIHHLHRSASELPVPIPYHIPKPKTYRFKRLPIQDLRASILIRTTSGGVSAELRKIQDTPHFATLKDGGIGYKLYLEEFRYALLTDDYSQEKLFKMSQLEREQIEAFDPILVKAADGYFQILDGVHRTSVSLFRGSDIMDCVEFVR